MGWWSRFATEDWVPETEGLHLDQNPSSKPDLDCVQGMVPLLPVTKVSGGLQVVPCSHNEPKRSQISGRYGHWSGKGEWCVLRKTDPAKDKAILLLAEPGDLVLWDSRT